VQEQPRNGNDNQRECRLAADQPHDHAPTPPAHGTTRDDNQCASDGTNANADTDAPPPFRWAS
jgi:hypothetical protein